VPNAFADIFQKAAELNRSDPRRSGNIVHLQPPCQVLLAGDIHGNRHNLQKIIDYAALADHPQRVLILQEIIHGPTDPKSGHDRSVELLAKAARLKITHPQQVLFLLGNHDIAQVTGNEITKEGHGVCRAFTSGVEFSFGAQAQEVMPAVMEFLHSMPLAVRCPNGVWMSHSLPSAMRMDKVDIAMLARMDYTSQEMSRGGTAYEWTWGRQQTPEQLAALGRELSAEFFVLGHRHSGNGYEKITETAISLSSDNEHGCVFEMNCDQPPTMESMLKLVRPIVALEKA